MAHVKLLLSLLFSILIINTKAQKITHLRIDPGSAQGGSSSQIFDKINYIPLETTKESLFGKIDQLIAYQHKFFILDKQTNAILIFAENGSFINKIYGGNSNNPYNQIPFFSIDPDSKCIVFSHIKNKIDHLLFYNFNGKLIKDMPLKEERPWQFNYFNSNKIAFFEHNVANYKTDSMNHLINIYDSVGRLIMAYFPYNQKTDILKNNDILYADESYFHGNNRLGAPILITRPYDYNVYRLSSNMQLDTVFNFTFPLENTLPKDFDKDPSYNNNRLKFLEKNNNMIFSVAHTYLLKNNFIFSLNTMGGFGDNSTYLYNLHSGNLICINKVYSDTSTSFLPIIKCNYTPGNYFIFSDGMNLYSYLSSDIMFKMKEMTVSKHPQYPPILQQYFSTQSRKSNPVIVQSNIKENL